MVVTELVLYLLLIAAIVLLGLRIGCCERNTGLGERIGKCMTIGRREVQEDAVAIAEKKDAILAVVADGMGKVYGGRISSRIAVETLCDLFNEQGVCDKPQYYFRRAFSAANQNILATLGDQRGGACVAAGLIIKNKFYYALAGNIKVAIFRDTDLVPISEGHTIGVLAKHKFAEGKITREDALQVLEKKRLYNFVGQDGFKDIEYFSEPIELKYGDIVVLMSDGVYECLKWREIENILKVQSKDCNELAFNIIQAVNKSKQTDKDNASVVLVRI